MSHSDDGNTQHNATGNFQMDALVGVLSRMFDTKLEQIHMRLDGVEDRINQVPQRANRPRRQQNHARQDDHMYDLSDNNASDEEEDRRSEKSYQRQRRHNGGRNRGDDLDGKRVLAPSFNGKNDPEAYLDWERKVDMIFEYHNFLEVKKIKLVSLEFTNYTMSWWDQVLYNRRKNREGAITTWEELKALMRKRFVPSHYYREMHKKLQRLSQGNRSVEEYCQDMERTMIRANIEEDEEATMDRFLVGLNPEIVNTLKLQHYVDLEELIHLARKIERQQKKGGVRPNRLTERVPWKPLAIPKKEKSSSNSKMNFKPSSSTTPTTTVQGNTNTTPTRNRDIKCFKCQGRGHMAKDCPNKRTMVIRTSGEIKTDDEGSKEDVENSDIED